MALSLFLTTFRYNMTRYRTFKQASTLKLLSRAAETGEKLIPGAERMEGVGNAAAEAATAAGTAGPSLGSMLGKRLTDAGGALKGHLGDNYGKYLAGAGAAGAGYTALPDASGMHDAGQAAGEQAGYDAFGGAKAPSALPSYWNSFDASHPFQSLGNRFAQGVGQDKGWAQGQAYAKEHPMLSQLYSGVNKVGLGGVWQWLAKLFGAGPKQASERMEVIKQAYAQLYLVRPDLEVSEQVKQAASLIPTEKQASAAPDTLKLVPAKLLHILMAKAASEYKATGALSNILRLDDVPHITFNNDGAEGSRLNKGLDKKAFFGEKKFDPMDEALHRLKTEPEHEAEFKKMVEGGVSQGDAYNTVLKKLHAEAEAKHKEHDKKASYKELAFEAGLIDAREFARW